MTRLRDHEPIPSIRTNWPTDREIVSGALIGQIVCALAGALVALGLEWLIAH